MLCTSRQAWNEGRQPIRQREEMRGLDTWYVTSDTAGVLLELQQSDCRAARWDLELLGWVDVS